MTEPSEQSDDRSLRSKRLGMIRHAMMYGLPGGLLVALLSWIDYRYVIVENAIGIYGGLIAAVFVCVGLVLGRKLTQPQPMLVPKSIEVEVEVDADLVTPLPVGSGDAREGHGITKRELEILALMASGLSNREIATRLFVSENTVKTHSSRLFEKLDVRRRTQAVQAGRKLGLIA